MHCLHRLRRLRPSSIGQLWRLGVTTVMGSVVTAASIAVATAAGDTATFNKGITSTSSCALLCTLRCLYILAVL